MVERFPWETAREVCTEKELEALKLWDMGWGYRLVGRHLGIGWTTARDRVQRALDKIEAKGLKDCA